MNPRFLTLVTGLLLASARAAHPIPLSPVASGWDKVNLTLAVQDLRPMDLGTGHVYVVMTLPLDPEKPRISAHADYNETSQNIVEVRELVYQAGRLQARLWIEIGPDGARRGRAHFPTPNDLFSLNLDVTLSPDLPAESLPNREAFMPPWRHDTPPIHGRQASGSYSGTWKWKGQAREVQGTVTGGWQPSVPTGAWGPNGAMRLAATDDGGLLLRADLPETRVAVGGAAWAERRFDPPLSLKDMAGLRVALSSPTDRNDAALAIQVETERGGYILHSAAFLRQERQETLISFDRLGDTWRPFAGEGIRVLRVGFANRFGVGKVEATLHGLELVPGTRQAPSALANVALEPDVLEAFNGVDTVPKGLFGFHDVGESKPREPKEGEVDAEEYLRQLNPGLLRPLTHTGFGGKPLSPEEIATRLDRSDRPEPTDAFYRRAKAGGALDLVVWTHTTDLWARPPWMDQPLEQVMERVAAHYRQEASRAWVPGDPYTVKRWFEVWNEPFMWGRHMNMGFRTPPGVKAWSDPEQYGYLPGRKIAEVYGRLFNAGAVAAKEVNPHVKMGGPSAPAFHEDAFGSFEHFVKPILDQVHPHIDFVTEHHYGGNPFSVAAGYEVVSAYLKTRYDREVPIINTEANDLGASDAGRAAYNLADILNLIRTSRDKVLGRALHACWNGYLNNPGEEHAYRLMAPLRGGVIACHSDNPALTVVASTPEAGRLVLVGLHHGRGDLHVRVPLPEGFALEECTVLLADAPAEELQLKDVDGAFVPAPEKGKTSLQPVAPPLVDGAFRLGLPERSAFRLILTREGWTPDRRVELRQQFADVVVRRLTPGEVLELPPLPAGAYALRLVSADVHPGEVLLDVGGHVLPLPTSSDGWSDVEIQDLLLPDLPAGSPARLRVRSGADANGAVLFTASWLSR